jgi:ribulose bisphosphate carboxylase small subunit
MELVKRDIKKEIEERLNNTRHTLHALEKQFEDGITAKQVDEALRHGFEIVEDYPEDPRGHSCLVLCWKEDIPLHVVCAPHEDALIIITTYIPTEKEWSRDFKERLKK